MSGDLGQDETVIGPGAPAAPGGEVADGEVADGEVADGEVTAEQVSLTRRLRQPRTILSLILAWDALTAFKKARTAPLRPAAARI